MIGQEKSHERVNQKRRTRAELLRAAREMTEKGLQPSVAEVADHAGISRATAYRYFSAPDELMREAALDGVAREIGRLTPDEPDENASVEDRVAALAGQVFDMVSSHETTFRLFLSNSITAGKDNKRGARRIGWLESALAPLQADLKPAEFRRLVEGLSLTLGIETIIVFKDVCEMSNAQAREATIWSARMLLKGVLAERAGR